MADEYLLMGGPADGKRQAVLNMHPRIIIREYPPIPLAIHAGDSLRELKITNHQYTRREMTGGYCVYAHTSLPTHEILPRLLRGYRPDAL